MFSKILVHHGTLCALLIYHSPKVFWYCIILILKVGRYSAPRIHAFYIRCCYIFSLSYGSISCARRRPFFFCGTGLLFFFSLLRVWSLLLYFQPIVFTTQLCFRENAFYYTNFVYIVYKDNLVFFRVGNNFLEVQIYKQLFLVHGQIMFHYREFLTSHGFDY